MIFLSSNRKDDTYEENVQSVQITNPIELGDDFDDKTFILDVNVLLNNNTLINLEMQMTNEHNWTDRSLSYLCRSYDQLYQGEVYSSAKPAIHIGFLNFQPFPDYPGLIIGLNSLPPLHGRKSLC